MHAISNLSRARNMFTTSMHVMVNMKFIMQLV